jgi:hypothetical protein
VTLLAAADLAVCAMAQKDCGPLAPRGSSGIVALKNRSESFVGGLVREFAMA